MFASLNYSLAEASDGGVWERRRQVRYPCNFEVRCESGRKEYTARVLDVSPGGMRLRFPDRVETGWRFTVAGLPQADFLGGQRVSCRAAWLSNSELGVVFEETPTCFERFWQAMALNKRRELRVPARLPVSVLSGGRQLARGMAVNFSIGGVTLHTDVLLRPGQLVSLQLGPWGPLPELRLFARVRTVTPVMSGHGQQACGMCFQGRTMGDFRLLLQYFRRLQLEAELEPS
ncbi:MAG: PilZ domain-containing protein [Armatimonadetes bacterium]|nr:PilZ domain-containing protein [Armatimonadota bacterium]